MTDILEAFRVGCEALDDPSLLFDEQGELEAVNGAFRRLAGDRTAEKDAPGKLGGFFDEGSQREIREAVGAALRGESSTSHLRLRGAGRSRRFTFRPLLGPGGRPSAVWAAADPAPSLHSYRAAEPGEAPNPADELEMVRVLIGSYGHEMNNILNVVHGFSSLIARKVRPEDPLYESVSAILEGSTKAASLVALILSLGLRRRPAKQPLDLAEEVRRAVDGEGPAEVDCAGELAEIRVDPDWIAWIVRWSLKSAFASGEPSPPTVSVEKKRLVKGKGRQPAGLASGAYQVLSFTVNRPFHSEEIARAFLPAVDPREKGWGVGLELAMARRMTHELGGECWAEDLEDGRRSALHYAFPVPEP